MNCISWNIGHLAEQEQRQWLDHAQGILLLPHLLEPFAFGAPASTPPLNEMWSAWHMVTQAADPWLDTLTTEDLQKPMEYALPDIILVGSRLQRVIYHYWYHAGENLAIRQLLGHTGLPDLVGNLDSLAPYVAE